MKSILADGWNYIQRNFCFLTIKPGKNSTEMKMVGKQRHEAERNKLATKCIIETED